MSEINTSGVNDAVMDALVPPFAKRMENYIQAVQNYRDKHPDHSIPRKVMTDLRAQFAISHTSDTFHAEMAGRTSAPLVKALADSFEGPDDQVKLDFVKANVPLEGDA